MRKINYSYYISPTEYEQAAQNGISQENLDKRVRLYGWKKERAMREPPRQKRNLTAWAEIAKQNGIAYKTFQRRMGRNWEIERAATQPIANRTELMKMQHEKNRKYPKEYVELAEKNGVQYRTFQWRMIHGWTLEDATNTRTLTTKEASSRAYKESWWSKGTSLLEKKGVKV